MEITGATFYFTKKSGGEGETISPEKPADDDKEKKPRVAGDKKTNSNKEEGKDKTTIGVFAYDMIKTGVQQTIEAVTANVSGSPTLQIQIQAAKQVGGKIIAYTAAVVSRNWAALATMAFSDAISFVSKQAVYERDKAWTDYNLDQYRERRGYSTLRNRR